MQRSDGKLTRARIVAAGLDIAAVHGWTLVGYKSVAAALGDVSWQNVKHHYCNTELLHQAILQHARELIGMDGKGRADLKAVQKRAAAAISEAQRLQLA